MPYGNDYLNTTFPESKYHQMLRPCGTFGSGMPTTGAQHFGSHTMGAQLNGTASGMPGLSGTVLGPQPLNGGVLSSAQALPTLPTGVPTGSAVPTMPSAVQPISDGMVQVPQTVQNVLFTPGFLRTQIGRRVRVEFLIGTNNLTDRTGTLVAVGASYIIIRPIESDDLMLCDIYSIKFVTIIL